MVIPPIFTAKADDGTIVEHGSREVTPSGVKCLGKTVNLQNAAADVRYTSVCRCFEVRPSYDGTRVFSKLTTN